MSIRELTNVLEVSHMTVRRDLSTLEEDGMVETVQGGARLAASSGTIPPAERGPRSSLNVAEKVAIAHEAAARVRDGMTIYLDAGTTCERLAADLAGFSHLTVVTNDFLVVGRLMDMRGVAIVHTGGEVDVESASSAGMLAVQTLEAMALDLAFLSTGSWDMDHGATTAMTNKVMLKRAAIAASESSILLADSTKFGTSERFKVVDLTELDTIITDDRLNGVRARKIAELGTELVRAEVALADATR